MARRKKTAARPGAPRDTVFEMKVSGFSVAQIAVRVGYSKQAVNVILNDPNFKEEVAQFRSARMENTGQKLEVAAEIGALAVAEVGRGFTVGQNGERTTIDPAVARERLRAAALAFSCVGFGTTTRVVNEGTTTNVNVNRQGPPVSDEDMARLQRLLDPG